VFLVLEGYLEASKRIIKGNILFLSKEGYIRLISKSYSNLETIWATTSHLVPKIIGQHYRL
jgi:hypothetical protein